ncbi:MAG: alkaline phosphatase [Candidatus Kapabacteria bacterium]|nr:alkaline phosphatase [Ignavibacteriota bacterium]MCW5883390.1 alkaline phosphatase [Candidatus Kapabacteria bacterium]
MKRNTTYILTLLLAIALISSCSDEKPKRDILVFTYDSLKFSEDVPGDYSTLENFGGDSIKNVILILGDGVGINQVLASRLMIYGPEGKMYCERFPVTGQSNTAPDDDNYITDSGAGATALATGIKTGRGMIGMSRDSIVRTSITELFRNQGYSTGIISTGQLADATPAGFSVNAPSRKMKHEIAASMSNTGINIFLGNSFAFDDKVHNGKSAAELALERGYDVIRTKNDFLNSNSNRIIALIDSMDILRDVKNKDNQLTLEEVTNKSIQLLNRNEKGFFLMIEEDGTDEYCHNHDIMGLTTQMKQMDDAIKAAVDFARKDGNTLVIVTADHETGGLVIVEANRKTRMMTAAWATGDHSPQPVPVYAIGPYSYLFTGYYENTHIPKTIAKILKF